MTILNGRKILMIIFSTALLVLSADYSNAQRSGVRNISEKWAESLIEPIGIAALSNFDVLKKQSG